MIARVLLFFVCLLSVSPSAHAQFGRTQPIYNVVEAPVATGSGKVLQAEQVKSIIMQVGTARGWIVREQEPGHLIATVTPRVHKAVVDIIYKPTSYSITYKDSDKLLYDGTVIHRNYNKWVKLLQRDIEQKFLSQ